VLGAHSTTPHVAAHTLRVLAGRPDLWAALVADRDLVPALVDEGSRWTSPTHHLVRRATTDVEIGGERIGAGDWVCAWVASANRDEQHFPDPYEFDPRRTPNPHLSFGAGVHFCIGTHLSRAALTMLFSLIVDRLGHVEIGPPTHLRSNWINGLTSQPIVAHRS
jgi:cytochrome P450